MLRSLTLLFCVAVSNSLHVATDPKLKSVDMSESLESLASEFPEGLTYPGLSELLVLDSEELLDFDKIDDKKPKAANKTAKAPKTVFTKEEVIKAGDGTTYPQNGDTVRVRMKGVNVVKHFHDAKFDNFMEYVYPAPSVPGIGGQKSSLPKDTAFLNQMTAGEVARFKITKSGKSSSDDVDMDMDHLEVELVSVNSAGAPEAQPEEHRMDPPSDEGLKLAKVLKAQKIMMATMRRTILSPGDGTSHVSKGDNVTVRISGTFKQNLHGKTVKMSQIQTYEYPTLKEPFKQQGFTFKYGWDEKTLPEMTVGEKQRIAFDPMQICLAGVCGPKFKFDAFELELLKIN
eukprot:gnl/MRDRNA2_/MRDRNA2_84704_c0_seq1.p1 gnl/MRDRNA2_/MRDRNA2_84704_c0~~gnl/MRDRNA2_/MRDRNA2_84704_c0_seq1.p1  ORF type:complete len:344 (+),score=98.42 gnl/MRDRNA2_/MRDRNA2_84704_c0_seq1:86-1117(+)